MSDTVCSVYATSDSIKNGRCLTTFNVVVDANQAVLHSEIDNSITSAGWFVCLKIWSDNMAGLKLIRTDYGLETLGERFTAWAKDAGLAIPLHPTGYPNP